MIISRTPFRMSFFGGGTDYPPWFREHGGAVISATFNKYCYISARELPPFFDHKYRVAYSKVETVQQIDEITHPAVRATLDYLQWQNTGLEIHHDADLPARSGLGSSSSFTVGLINVLKALRGEYVGKKELAQLAIHVEQNVIKETVGSQDQIAAAYGGFNRIDFHTNDKFSVTPLVVKPEKIKDLQSHLMLFFTGFSRFAVEIADSKLKNLAAKAESLHTIRQMVDEGIDVLQSETDLDDFGRLLHAGWLLKRSLSSKVSNSAIDDIYEAARKAGALGGKILGAGGGGFMLLFVKPELQAQVKEALSSLLHIPFEFEYDGSKIVLYQPNGL
jgi:D-glycero-alpha-D-manno-heptose-7-phosphate kinase